MKHLPIMTCMFLGILLIAGLAAAEVTVLRTQDNGNEIKVKSGAFIELALEEQGGTGYTWEFHRLDEEHFQLMHTETKHLSDPPRMGGPVLKVWQLKTKAQGDAKLSLDYLRPWEGRAKAVKHFEVNVCIQ
jgi:predicted secreted protein